MPEKYRAKGTSLDPTAPDVFFNRREFLSATATATIGLAAASSAYCTAMPEEPSFLEPPFERPGVFPPKRNDTYKLPQGVGTELTSREAAGSHNNFYEFLPGRAGAVWRSAGDFEVEPWKVEVGGECRNPQTLDLDALFAFPHEERLYHFRCVERWAMNVPWSGFPLRLLIEKAEPTAKAKYVRFVTAARPNQMPGLQSTPNYPWPYQEALRLDEAMNELALVVTGVYGEPLVKQHGAPVRVIVPWKYGYKNPKSIVEIEFTAKEPDTFWQIQPHEYGFLSNVNPNIPHPRWSQAQSRWLESQEWFPTPMFNGYDEYVAALYPDEPRTPQKPLRRGQKAR